jgi:hypothetical protein
MDKSRHILNNTVLIGDQFHAKYNNIMQGYGVVALKQLYRSSSIDDIENVLLP